MRRGRGPAKIHGPTALCEKDVLLKKIHSCPRGTSPEENGKMVPIGRGKKKSTDWVYLGGWWLERPKVSSLIVRRGRTVEEAMGGVSPGVPFFSGGGTGM